MLLEAVASFALICAACEERGGYPFGMPFARSTAGNAGSHVASGTDVSAAPHVKKVAPPSPFEAQNDDDAQAVRPKMITRIEPAYPTKALRESLEGRVVVRFQIAPDGIPFNLTISHSDNAVFDGPVLSALAKSRFEPEAGDKPIYGGRWFKQPYAFRLDEGAPASPAP